MMMNAIGLRLPQVANYFDSPLDPIGGPIQAILRTRPIGLMRKSDSPGYFFLPTFFLGGREQFF